MGRRYYAAIDIAAGSAQLDIIEVVAATEVPLKIIGLEVTTDIETDANEVQLGLDLKRVTGAFTSGSGGATVNGIPVVQGDAADSATVETGNTTKNTGGTSVILASPYMNNRAGWLWLPPDAGQITIAGTDAFVAELVTTPASTAFGGWCLYEELT